MVSEQDCLLMTDVSMSLYLRSVLIFTLLSCLLCVPMAVYSLYRIKRSVKLHFNSKCVFFVHNTAIFVHCSVRLVLHGKDLLNYFGPWSNGCEMMPSRSRCDLRILYKLTQYVVEVTPFVMTVERVMATFCSKHYENRYKWLGVCLLGCHLVLSITMLVIQNSSRTGEEIVYYCLLASSGNVHSFSLPLVFIFLTQLTSIPTLLFLLKKNKSYYESHQCASLTQRYQIFENLRTMNKYRIMSIVTWLYVTCDASATFLVHFYLPLMPLASQYATVEITHCIPIYYIIVTIAVLREENKPAPEFAIRIDKTTHPGHFNELQRHFDEAFVKIQSQHQKIVPRGASAK